MFITNFGVCCWSRMSEASALPLEVIRLVAANMSTAEWAGVSRTCRAWASLQPKAVQLWPVSIPQLRWMVRHWQEAESVACDFSSMELDSEEAQEILDRGARVVGALRRLQLGGLEGPKDGDAGYHGPTEWLQHLFAAVAGSLEALQLTVPASLQLPPLQQLKHAVLQLDAAHEEELPQLAFLQQLPHVETLSLENNVSVTLVIPALDLTCSPRLRAVNIRHLVPALLQLPATCTSATHEADWQVTAAHVEQLCTLLTCMNVVDERYLEPPSRPMLLIEGLSSMLGASVFKVLTVLHIFIEGRHSLQPCPVTLGSSVAALQELNIRCNSGLVLTLAAPLALRRLDAQALNSLVLIVECPQVLIRTLSRLQLVTTRGRVMTPLQGIACPGLLEALVDEGHEAAVQRCIDRYNEYDERYLSYPEDYSVSPVSAEAEAIPAPVPVCMCGYKCGACSQCLKAAGILDS